MATEVLRPHDCLIERIRLPPATVFPRRRNFYNYHYHSHPTKPSRTKPAPAPARFDHKRKASDPKGQVTILRRGEALDLKPETAKASDGNDYRSRSLSPRPDVYAGSAISVSPSPESLPLPSFSKKKQVSMTVDDSATRDLRRLLRLD